MANYITQRASGYQFIVISLKEEFYCHADALVGIYSEVSQTCIGEKSCHVDGKLPQHKNLKLWVHAL